jgi:tRNA dimethylallyltransferase
MRSHQEMLAIVGPTASGKTELGLRLAKEQNGEIISVDSRQVYKYLSIGTAKPPKSDILYHLIDFLEPSEKFSAADFVRLATAKVAEIQSRGKTPIFVGGTGLYFKALTEGLAALPPADAAVRNRLKKEAETNGREALHKRLAGIDPEAAAKIPANNIQRLIRALEVYEITGKPISQWHKEHQNKIAASSQPSRNEPGLGALEKEDVSPMSPLGRGRSEATGEAKLPLKFVGIDLPRAELVHRIEARCRTMIEEGMIEETRAVLKRGFAEDCPALTGLGYPRIIRLLKGTLSRDECLALLIQDTRQYAKRQMTWFRRQFPVLWKK